MIGLVMCCSASLDVRRQINLVGQLGDVHLEPVLDLVQDLGVGLVGDEGDGLSLEERKNIND